MNAEIRTIEELTINAFPALQTEIYDGWLLRFSNGYTYRANCICQIYSSENSTCDKNKLTDKGCTCSPDMIVEVVSAFNPRNDYIMKLNLYEQFKVREYWIVNPIKKNIIVYTFNDKVKVNIYDNLEIDFNSVDI